MTWRSPARMPAASVDAGGSPDSAVSEQVERVDEPGNVQRERAVRLVRLKRRRAPEPGVYLLYHARVSGTWRAPARNGPQRVPWGPGSSAGGVPGPADAVRESPFVLPAEEGGDVQG